MNVRGGDRALLLRALFLRPSFASPWRFAVTLLGVAAGVAAVIATLAASRAALASLRAGVRELAGGARFEIVQDGGLPETALATLRPLASDVVLVPVIEDRLLAGEARVPARLLGIDPLVDGALRTFQLGAGGETSATQPFADMADFLGGRGVWLAEPLARTLGLERGDEFAFELRARREVARVLGVFQVPAADSQLGALLVIDVARAQELCGKLGRLDRIELDARSEIDEERLRERVATLLPRARLQEPAERAERSASLVQSLEFNLTALSAISILVAAVLVATTLATSVVQRARTIALLRSLGASRAQIARTIFVEAAALGLGGGVLGVVLGLGLAQALLPSMRQTFATVVATSGASTIRFDAGEALFGVALALVAACVAALLPVAEAWRMPPLQALRGEAPVFLTRRARRIALALATGSALLAVECMSRPAWNGLPIAALASTLIVLGTLAFGFAPVIDAMGRIAARIAHLPVALRLACGALAAGRRRAAWAATAVGVAVALSVSVATMVTSFRTSLVDWTAQTLRADLSIRARLGPEGGATRLAPEVTRLAADALPEARFAPLVQESAAIDGREVSVHGEDFRVLASREALDLVRGKHEDEPASQALARALADHQVFVNEAAAQRFALEPGDAFTLQARDQQLALRVAGVVRDFGDTRGTVLFDTLDFVGFFGPASAHHVDVYLPPDLSPALAHERLTAALEPRYAIELISQQGLREQVLQVFERTFAITKALQGVAAVVAVIAVASVLFALVRERRAQLALIAALGASRAQVLVQVCAQAATLGALGAVGGSLVGFFIGIVLVQVVHLQSFGWSLTFVPPHAAIAGTTLVVVAACIAASLFPARAAARTQLGAALREE